MGYQFTLKLNRVITDKEFAALGEAGCTGFTMTTYSLPLDDSVAMQIDVDTEAASLAEAIQAGLDAVNAVPDLRVSTLDVPAQPSGLPANRGLCEAESPGETQGSAEGEGSSSPGEPKR